MALRVTQRSATAAHLANLPLPAFQRDHFIAPPTVRRSCDNSVRSFLNTPSETDFSADLPAPHLAGLLQPAYNLRGFHATPWLSKARQ